MTPEIFSLQRGDITEWHHDGRVVAYLPSAPHWLVRHVSESAYKHANDYTFDCAETRCFHWLVYGDAVDAPERIQRHDAERLPRGRTTLLED
jgi:hypothetical protein